jgi:hypothetical protein
MSSAPDPSDGAPDRLCIEAELGFSRLARQTDPVAIRTGYLERI